MGYTLNAATKAQRPPEGSILDLLTSDLLHTEDNALRDLCHLSLAVLNSQLGADGSITRQPMNA